MPTTPLRVDSILEEGARPRDWQPRSSGFKVPIRLVRLCLLGAFLPAILVAGPLYLRYRVYSEQLYPLTISDQRLIDGRVSTTWCQRQVVKVNGTFNAYLMRDVPEVKREVIPVSMTRHLILENDMKEYWGFYLLRGSSVTVSTCVRWPGASLTMIRGHKHLHECAFIGDDSSEELEELLEVAQERGLLTVNGTLEDEHPSNEPEKMKRVRQGIQFLQQSSNPNENDTLPIPYHYSSHELDAKAMRSILTELFRKTLETKKKQKESPHHHYEGVFKESANIDKPPVVSADFPYKTESEASTEGTRKKDSGLKINPAESRSDKNEDFEGNPEIHRENQSTTLEYLTTLYTEPDNVSEGTSTSEQAIVSDLISTTEISPGGNESDRSEAPETASGEVFREILGKLGSLGDRGKAVLKKLVDQMDEGRAKAGKLRKMVNEAMVIKDSKTLRKRKRELILSSPLGEELTQDDSEADAAVEEGLLHPDGIAEDRGTVNETTLNDRSNSEFWSSFSSSEERLLDCKGLILNLPLTPHQQCTPKFEKHHHLASLANTVTYRVPTNGYYFFVFNSENEIQPNYIRIRFELLKTVYDTSDPIHACKNTTEECSLPLNFFSGEKAVLELPLGDNDSQWNEEFVVVSTCEPRTAVYMICIITVPLLIMLFAFH
ncbi:uncharacterized protein LOC105695339 [Orussus abietinus]|uniref:uncharacterized protein LOC105695339 n=1 Tax=Orussus abietinus TaxID=222816 RepID=UPI000625AAA9|nr:uncharacterized protein LOC105695339 [Orussus abietinus]XP_012272255.1 uncharacterized protein LOC105695339 [Orussus abietinus]